MELLFSTVKTIFQLAVIGVMVLVFLANRMPNVEWLRPFRVLFRNRLTPEQQERLRRSQNRTAGLELILLGLAAPFGLMLLSVMTFFSEITTLQWALCAAFSIGCIALGVTALVKSR